MERDYIDRLLEASRDWFVAGAESNIEEKLSELDEKCCKNCPSQDQDELSRLLSVRLISEALRVENVQLCRVALKRLKLDILITLVDQKSPSESAKLVSNYFKIDLPAGFDGFGAKSKTSEISERLALQVIDGTLLGESACVQELTLYKNAQQDEVDENFAEALTSYESSGTCQDNLLRVSMKHLMCASHHVLSRCCLDKLDLRSEWFNYLIACGKYQEAASFCVSLDDEISAYSVDIMQQTVCDKLSKMLPAKLCEFVSMGESKWNNVKQLDEIISKQVKDNNARAHLAELASHYLEHGDLDTFLSIAFNIGLATQALDLYLAQHANHPMNLSVISTNNFAYHCNSQLLHHLTDVVCYNVVPNRSVIGLICNDLGLLDELLQLIARSNNLDTINIGRLVEHLENIIDSESSTKLGSIDPLLTTSTISDVFSLLKQENDRSFSTSMMTIIISIFNIYLLKLDQKDMQESNHLSIPNLEVMFQCIGSGLEEIMFNASDSLIRATNSLVSVIKSRLDALADSEVVRNNFIKIVDKVAGLCLIDARYKSAAILYSQLEDNVSAIKALMRTGDAETVMNYALLVRDITVDRITINYIKHLKLEPEIIENFIRRSKL